MRLSCNGCRVLRKGCCDNCSIRPCLEWIRSPESQAHATVFLAKFYGRTGLINLINAGPQHLRPAIFRSLLYEACGRMVNPVSGSVGLMRSDSWQLCQSAVEAVLQGAPITQKEMEAESEPPVKPFGIRHVVKENSSSGSGNLHRVRTRRGFKRSRVRVGSVAESGMEREKRSGSHESSLSHQWVNRQREESLGSAELEAGAEEEEFGDEIELDLTLGLGTRF